MSKVIHKGIAIVFGLAEPRPIVNIPPAATKVRLRLRNNQPGRAFVRYPDRTEHWILFPADGRIGCTEWKLGALQGTNTR